MIYIRLAGGLGNQLFQLAAGLEVQFETQMPIVFYTEALNNYAVKREATLLSVIELSEKIQLCKNSSDLKIKLLKYRFGRLNLSCCINNNTISKVNYKQKFYLLDGYFQDIQFIQNGINQVKTMIGKYVFDDSINQIFSQIVTSDNEQETICSLHIRRGDYTALQNKAIYPLLDGNYYKNGIKSIGQKINKLVIFSDDNSIEFDFFKDYEIIRILNFKLTDCQEFILMSLFKNIIIANSTFSFWAANCNSSLQKSKIAPSNWIHNENENKFWIKNLETENFKLI